MPKPQGYRLSPRARNDLEDIWLYTFQNWSRVQADGYYSELTAAMSRLADGSKRGGQFDNIKPGYLCLSCGSHYIVYKQTDTQITIVRVLHQRMNISRHL
ncbi:type II toxin-antitoxin system RelE/ParE family toxin [Rhizobium sp. XQZ8]|uniref:type II toxin-antitoxin system RelE/ParE family toxin n=1 Tax=Rhizobium populisoli TaxID=2859785 RepID=UPI001C680579|nr:type II toxin-antitoxin system RelE/ParE family toxin [Rhizobium populisoli]MBW6423957.1 type II toxin-antitoxin system RelE/ParE family toxin [Rhizobium populisoli]